MIEIDNKKMLESIYLAASADDSSLCVYILQGLQDQGYTIKSGEIVSIEPEFNGIPIRAGRWYICDCEIINENQTVAFHRDETYYCPKDGWLDVKGLPFEVGALNIDFHPATEEEIPHEPYFKVGDRVRRKGTSTKGDVITNIYESGGVTMYEFENSEDAPQSLSWELVDNSQRMTSVKANEALLPDGELTEFEKAVQQTISSYLFLPHDIDHCVQREDAFNFYKKAASCLLSIAYKKFIEEACEWLDENLINYWSQAYTDNCDFIEDFRKALEKGD